MSRWFRFYDDVVGDPKAQMLSDNLFRSWVNLLCIASKNGGSLPDLAAVAYYLRMNEAKAAETLTRLCKAGLLDKHENTFAPHNWNGRQFKTDADDKSNAARQSVTVTRPVTATVT